MEWAIQSTLAVLSLFWTYGIFYLLDSLLLFDFSEGFGCLSWCHFVQRSRLGYLRLGRRLDILCLLSTLLLCEPYTAGEFFIKRWLLIRGQGMLSLLRPHISSLLLPSSLWSTFNERLLDSFFVKSFGEVLPFVLKFILKQFLPNSNISIKGCFD